MHAMKKAKMAALQDLIRQLRKKEVGAFEGKESPEEELAEHEEMEEDDDLKVAEPLAMAQGRMTNSSDEDDEDDDGPVPGMKKFMKRSSSEPIRGQTKSVMIAITAGKPDKPGRSGKKS